MSIRETFEKIRSEIPGNVTIVLAAKTRTPDEVRAAEEAGATDIGHNYVQEAEAMRAALSDPGTPLRWHMIGPLQKNKINKAIRLFDCIQTIDSYEMAAALNRRAEAAGVTISALIEINSGREAAKSGLPPDYEVVQPLIEKIALLKNIRVNGLMTMAPYAPDPEDSRPFFKATKQLFDRLQKTNLPDVDMEIISMGMSDTYRIAVEEGSTMVRLGTVVFGARK